MIGFFVFVIGSMVGSFLNVCIYRMPEEESIVTPRSHCTHCKKQIFWYDNIPFISYIFLRGKCRFCKKPISMRYLVVELLTALSFFILYLTFGLTVHFFVYAAWMSALIVASFIDLSHQIIPDEISLGGLIVGLLLSALYPSLHGVHTLWLGVKASLMGALVGGGAIYLIGVFGNFVFKKESMGGGDVKLLAMVGAVLGWRLTLVAFFVAPFFGSVVGITLKIRQGTDVIPYGPFLSLGSVIALFWGERILHSLGFVI